MRPYWYQRLRLLGHSRAFRRLWWRRERRRRLEQLIGADGRETLEAMLMRRQGAMRRAALAREADAAALRMMKRRTT